MSDLVFIAVFGEGHPLVGSSPRCGFLADSIRATKFSVLVVGFGSYLPKNGVASTNLIST